MSLSDDIVKDYVEKRIEEALRTAHEDRCEAQGHPGRTTAKGDVMKLKSALATVVLALVSLAGTARAQSSDMRGYVDWAESQAPEQITLAGWAFQCATAGQQPFSVKVYYDLPAATGVAQAQILVRYNGLNRPDVAAAFTPSCGKLNAYTGFTLIVGGIPAGPQRLTIQWADSRGALYLRTAVVVVQDVPPPAP